MKFTPKEDFRQRHTTYEAGNTYDSDKYLDVSEADVRLFHAAGWAEVEGMDPAPPRQPGPVRLGVQNATHTTDDTGG